VNPINLFVQQSLVEIQTRSAVLNRYTALGIPVTEPIGQVRTGKGQERPSFDLCNEALQATQVVLIAPAAKLLVLASSFSIEIPGAT
jgi:hypothetical protein